MNMPKKRAEDQVVHGDVAIIGMACVFPGANDLKTYWHNILAKFDAVRDVPPGRWDPETYFSKEADDINKVYCKRGGYLDESMVFDPLKYGVMPVAVEGGEPDQFLVLQVVHEALKDAGYLDRDFDGKKTEFILGRGNYLGVGASNLIQRSLVTEQTLKILKSLHPEYTKEELTKIRQELINCLPKFSSETAASFIPNLTAGRVANRLDFMGPNFTVDAACASSLIAAEIGVRDLLTGKCDMALAGGVHIFANVPFLLIFCAFQAMSHKSQIRPFDQDADGTIPGEGAGVLVLKRLKDAEQDGDRIYAVIKGLASSSDGRAVSVMAPRIEGEELALRRAYDMAKVSPESIRLIEAHGVGTAVGDVVEVEAMRRVFGSRDSHGPKCALGSVKSMIGHAMPAAGAASLIKTALSLYHKVLPPTLHCQKVNPKLEIEKTPFYLNTETRPWIHGEKDFPRRAGINAFGFGGINAHVVLEEYVPAKKDQETSPQRWETEVFIFHGDSRQDLIQQLHGIQKFIQHNLEVPLCDLAFSLNKVLDNHPYRLAVVASCVSDLEQKLNYALQRLFNPDCHQIKDLKGIYFFESPLSTEGKLAFMFPGEGAQYLNMLADLCIFFPEVRACFDKADRILLEQGQLDLPSSCIFPPPFFSEEERLAAENHLWKMDRATEAVLIGNQAMYTILTSLGLKPDQMVGHSAGEWSAMIFSGIIDVDEFMQNTRKLNNIYRKLSEDPEIPKATLIAVGTSRDQVTSMVEEIEGTIYVANDNCPHQVVIIGEEKTAAEAVRYLRARGIPFEKLSFDRGYHTPLFSPICPHLREYFSSLSISPPQSEVYSCNTMAPYPDEPEKILKLAVETWVLPVAFSQTIENMYKNGTRIFIEVGPKGNLTAFVEDILRGKPHLAVPSNVTRRSGITQLNHMVGLLNAQGINLNLGYLYKYRTPGLISWTQKPENKASKNQGVRIPLGLYSLSLTQRHKDTETQRHKGTENKSEFSDERLVESERRTTIPPFASASSSFSVMDQYIQTMELFLDTQKETMQAYLEKRNQESGVRSQNREQNFLYADSRHSMVQPYHSQYIGKSEEVTEQSHQTNNQSKSQPDDQPVDRIPIGQSVDQPIAQVEGQTEAWDGDLLKERSESTPAKNTAQILVEIVSEKTGYPSEMIDLNLDMEADLGIDSIKRVEIIGSFREKFAHLEEKDLETVSSFKTLQQVVDFLNKKVINSQNLNEIKDGSSGAHSHQPGISPSPEQEKKSPFLGRTLELKPGQSVSVLRQVDMSEDLFLNDHRFGQKISGYDTFLGALPVIPLTVGLEIMAEVASLLFPGQRLIRVEKMTASQWICVNEQEPTTLYIMAESSSTGNAVVQVYNLGKKEELTQDKKPIMKAEVVFAKDYPDPPPWPEFTLDEERLPSHTAAQVYEEHRMFHGQRFQGIASMDMIGTNGLRAHLKTLPQNNLFKSFLKPHLLTDPFLLDAAGQLVGYWPVEYLENGFVIFPISLASLSIYQETPPPGTHLETQMRLRQISTNKVLADIDIRGKDGKLWMQLVGWEDWRFYWSKELYDFWRFPNQGIIGKALDLPATGGAEDEKTPGCSMVQQFWSGKGDVFQDVMAYMVLGRKEREIYEGMAGQEKQGEWLLTRMAIKDAMRIFWQKYYHLPIFPADLDMIDDEQGQVKLNGVWLKDKLGSYTLATSYKDGAAIAVVAQEKISAAIELISLQSFQNLEGLVLSPEEEALLSLLDNINQADWVIRLWGVKKVIAKALMEKDFESVPLGPEEAAQAVIADEIDIQSGEVKVSLGEKLKKRFLDSEIGPIRVYTAREKNYIIAITIF